MSLNRSEDSPGEVPPSAPKNEELETPTSADMDSAELDKTENEFHLANETVDVTPRSTTTGASSGDVVIPLSGKKAKPVRLRPKTQVGKIAKKPVIRPTPPISSIPLPVKLSGPIKSPGLQKNSKCVSRTSTVAPKKTVSLVNKHTLEVQFINKKKQYEELISDLVLKQKPVMELYRKLLLIKNQLETQGRVVHLDDLKVVSFQQYKETSTKTGGGEQMSIELVNSMKCSIEEIPKTLMDICKNLLSRRALIVELLESVTKSEIDMNQVSPKIESLKREGQQLQQSLDAIIEEHEQKINQLVTNWQKLLIEKQSCGDNGKIEELDRRLKEEERLREDSSNIIQDLHRKLEDRKLIYEKSMTELNGVLETLKEQIKKLEQELDVERKANSDLKSRNNTNAQNLKITRSKINELEIEKSRMESANVDLQKRIRYLEDQMKQKEKNWIKEKEEMNKSLKHQENLLQKLTADKNQFETRLEETSNEKKSIDQKMETTITSLQNQVAVTMDQLQQAKEERDKAIAKCEGLEEYVAKLGLEFKENMKEVSCCIEWGKVEGSISVADQYMEIKAKNSRIRELEDKIAELQQQNVEVKEGKAEEELTPLNLELELESQKERITNYEKLLAESETKLKLKSDELQSLGEEIRQLKIRQQVLEEENDKCSVRDLQELLDEGRQKLAELMKKSIEHECKLEEYKATIASQRREIVEMDTLLRYRDNMASVLRASRNDLLLEKESLSRYSKEVRTALNEMSNQVTNKNKEIELLQDKIELREAQMSDLQKELRDMESKLEMANQKRYKLQETVGSLERDLQQTQARLRQLTLSQPSKSRLPWRLFDSVYEVVEDKKSNKRVSFYSNRLMDSCNDTGRQNHTKSTNTGISPENHLSHQSSDHFSYKNSHYTDDTTSSQHTNCYHQANSRSLISLSLHTVDFIKTRLNFLASVNTPLPENSIMEIVNSQSETDIASDDENLDKILQLSKNRYEYLHNQTQQSYDDLSNLVKLAVVKKSGVKK